MSKIEHDPHLANINGAEQHHALKNQPGEHGDPDHASSNGTLSDELRDAVADAKGDSELAAELQRAAAKKA